MSTSEPPKPEEPKTVSTPEEPTPAASTPPAAEPAPAAAGRRRWRPGGRSGLILGGVAVLLVGLVVGGGIGFAAGHHGGGHRGGPGFHHGMGQHHGMGHPGMPGGPGRGGPGPGGPEERGPGADGGGGGGFGMRLHEDGMGGSSALIGTVASVNGTAISVTEDGAGPVTVTTSERTRVFGEQKRAVSDLKQGDRVMVQVGPDRAALGVRAIAASARGTVTALNGTSATLTRTDGLTQTVDTSGLTTQPKVGDLVAVQGAVADNGSTLKAQTLRTLPKTN